MTAFVVLDNREIVITFVGAKVLSLTDYRYKHITLKRYNLY